MRTLVIMGLLGSLSRLDAAPVHFSSGPARVSLIELYTSEGCSSCPPADQWLGSLRGNLGLWKEFVPVQFHVNYWDGLGWKDSLSTPSFTRRQYAYSTVWGSPNVYTPCFVRDGIEWRPGWGMRKGPGAPAGVLSVDVASDGSCQVEFSPDASARLGPGAAYEVHLAYLGGGISSRVTAGENRGETLKHEFVVLGIADKAMASDKVSLVQRATLSLPSPIEAHSERHALAAWITLKDKLEPVQSTGGWL